MQLHQSRSLLLPGVLIMITLAMTSAFLHTTPPATSIGALRQEKGRQVGGGSTKSRRSRVFPSLPSGVTPRRPSKMLLAGAGAGAGAGDLLSPVGAIVSSAIVHAHAHLLSGPGVGTGLLLLAEESDKPGNIYGKIALGGVAIAFSSVFGAYIIATLVANMSTEDLMKLNRDLAGGEEYEELERERERSQVRLAALAQQMEDAKDPARSLGLAPDGVREKKLEELTARVSTDIASIDDEYSD